MPKCCGMCNAFFEKGDGFSCTITDTEVERLWYKRNKDCPLVEIPSKHGDLIDRDSLQKQSHVIEEYHPELQRQGVPKKVIYIEDVVKAPTIIEAEG